MRSSDFPSNPELSQVSKFSPNWATQPAKRLCPGVRGQRSDSSFPRKAPVPSKWRGPAPHTGPRKELEQSSRLAL